MRYTIGQVDDELAVKKIEVFRESAEWDKARRWFMVPMHTLQSLHVATFVVNEDLWDERPEYVVNQIENIYPADQYVQVR